MLGLLYKDYCVMKKNIYITARLILFYSIPLFLPAGVWEKTGLLTEVMTAQVFAFRIIPIFIYFTIFSLIGILQKGLFEHDERKVWSNYVGASPLGYKGQMLSKYYFTLLFSFTFLIWGYFCDMFSSLAVGSIESASGIYTTLFYIQIIAQAIEYPFIVRFGHKHGNTFKLLFFIMAIYGIIVWLLFGKLPEGLKENFFEFLISLATGKISIPTIILGFRAVLPYIALLLFYLSYKLSCKWYVKGVESYGA